MHIERPVRMQMWIAAIAIGLLVASAIFAIVRSIAISYANPPDRSARASQDVGASGSREARPEEVLARDAAAAVSMNRRLRTGCGECGVVKSLSQIERYGDVGGQGQIDARAATHFSDRANASNVVQAKSYHVTIRFRDGSTTAFNEATPRNWRAGSRVIVIAGSNASID